MILPLRSQVDLAPVLLLVQAGGGLTLWPRHHRPRAGLIFASRFLRIPGALWSLQRRFTLCSLSLYAWLSVAVGGAADLAIYMPLQCVGEGKGTITFGHAGAASSTQDSRRIASGRHP